MLAIQYDILYAYGCKLSTLRLKVKGLHRMATKNQDIRTHGEMKYRHLYIQVDNQDGYIVQQSSGCDENLYKLSIMKAIYALEKAGFRMCGINNTGRLATIYWFVREVEE